MNKAKEIREIEDKIKEEFKILSESLFRASHIMESFPNLSKAESPQIIQILNNSSEKETKESEEPVLLQKKRKRKNRKAYKIFCKDYKLKDNKTGYTIHVNYLSKNYKIGPYLNLDFVTSIKEDMIKCLSNISEKESLTKIDKCIEQLKNTLYSKYPAVEEEETNVKNKQLFNLKYD